MGLLDKVRSTAPPLPSRVYFYAPEKFGKSSFAAYAPKPIFVMTEGETGLLSLMEAGRVPETPHFPEDCKSWEQLLDYCRAVLDEPHGFRSLIIDTANGAERLLAAHVLHYDFNGRTGGKEGFSSYGKGNEACIAHWQAFLQLLDRIRVEKKMMIVLLAHTRIKTVNNPSGPDYDQLRPEGIEKLWPLTHKWSDIIACGAHELLIVDDKVKESKGRVIHTTSTPAVVAGNRYGLPDKIPCGASAQQAWKNFQDAVVKAKSAGRKPTTEATPTPGLAPVVVAPVASAPNAAPPVEVPATADMVYDLIERLAQLRKQASDLVFADLFAVMKWDAPSLDDLSDAELAAGVVHLQAVLAEVQPKDPS